MSRRAFLLSLSAATLSGCATALPSLNPEPDAAELRGFMALSRVLTGVDGLDAETGRRHLLGIDARARHALPLLYARGGFSSPAPPTTFDDLAATGVLHRREMRRTAEAVARAWYTGRSRNGSDIHRVTYVSALAWSTLRFTKAPSVCGGGMGSWSDAPRDRSPAG